MRGITLSDGRFIPAVSILSTLMGVRGAEVTRVRRNVLEAEFRSHREKEDETLRGILNFLDAVEPEGAENCRKRAVDEGTARMLGSLTEALEALADMADPDSLRIISLMDRLLADDWTGSGVYEALDQALTLAESQAPVSA